VLGEGTLWHQQKFFQYIILEFNPSTILLHPPLLPFPGIVLTSIIFPFTYICAQYLHYVHSPSPFPLFFSPLTDTNTSRQDLLHSPVLQFCIRKKEKEKKDIFACVR
jgi:hypothetical protein